MEVDPLPLPPQDKLVAMNFPEKMGDFCLVCFSKVDRSKLPKQSSLLSNNLNVIFLLRNLLQVPSDLLLGHFKKCGSPAYWISLCENCSQLTSQAMEHHLQILKLVNQLRTVLKLFTEKMRESSGPSETLTSYQDDIEDDKKKSMQEKRLDILKRTRDFVINYNYNVHLVNPFIEGDKLAGKLDGNEDNSSSDDSGEEEDSAVEWEDDGVGGGEWGGDWQDDEDDDGETEAPFVNEQEEELTRYVKVDGKFKCRYCETLLSYKRSLRAHELAKHPLMTVRGRLECDICGKMVNSKLYLDSHREKGHQIDTAGNPINNKQSKMKMHVGVDGKWKCRHCEKLFLSKNAVCVHEKEKHPSTSGCGKFTCDICGKTWNSKSYFSSHLNKRHTVYTKLYPITIPTGEPHLKVDGKWKCRHCEKCFESYKTVWTHERNTHPPALGQFKCEICGKTWNSLSYLRVHQRRIHQIDSAGNSIVSKPKKRRKRKPNVKPKIPSTCDLCGKSFSWKFGLTQHLKFYHEKEFSIRCHVCGLGVYKKYNLNTHLLSKHKDDPVTLKLIQEGVKFWKCGVKGCRATFRKASGLEEHMKNAHGGGGEKDDVNKRFTCAFCGKTFWYWYKLKNHENLHKLGTYKPYSCDVCGNKYRSMDTVRKHKRRFH